MTPSSLDAHDRGPEGAAGDATPRGLPITDFKYPGKAEDGITMERLSVPAPATEPAPAPVLILPDLPREPTVAGDTPRTGVSKGTKLSSDKEEGGRNRLPPRPALNSRRFDRADALGRTVDTALPAECRADDGVCKGVLGAWDGADGGGKG